MVGINNFGGGGSVSCSSVIGSGVSSSCNRTSSSSSIDGAGGEKCQ